MYGNKISSTSPPTSITSALLRTFALVDPYTMDKLNDITAQKNPHLVKVKECKGHGIRSGMLTLGLVGGVSYMSLRVPVISQMVPVRYHLLVVMSTALISGYLATAYVTRKCYIELKNSTNE